MSVRTQLLAVAVKEIRQTARDKQTLGLLLVAPVAQLLLLGFAVNLDTTNVPLVAADEDRSTESRAFVRGLTAADTFALIGMAHTGIEALEIVEAADAAVAIVVPPGFGEHLRRGDTAHIQVLADGADSNRAIVAQNAASAYAATWGLQYALSRATAAPGPLARPPRVRVEPRLLYNPTLNSRHFFVPGVGATLLMIITTIVTAMGLAREKEQGTLEAVMVTPISPLVLVLGKTLPYAIIGLAVLGLVLATGAAVFGVPMRGSLWLVFTGGLLYMLTTLGLGLFIASTARTQQQAFVGAFSIMMPMVLLSGFVSPIENMPRWLAAATVLDPMRHFVELMRGVLLKDATWWDMLPQLSALAGLGLLVFLLSVRAMGRKLS